MKVFLAGTSFHASYGGPAYSVSQLAAALAVAGIEVGLWAPDGSALESPLIVESAMVRRLAGEAAAALDEFGGADVIHDNGIWLGHNHQLASLATARGIPRVVSIRGMLEPWAMNHKKWKKRLAWWLYQRKDLHRAAALHATAESEAAQLRKLGFKQRIIVAANGVGVEGTSNIEHPTSNVEFQVGRDGLNAQTSSTNHDPLSTIRNPVRTALFLSRIHPKKGLPLLLEAWARLRPDGWQLRIVGPDEGGHTAELKRLCDKLGLEWGEGKERAGVRGQGAGESLGSAPGHIPKITDNGPRTTDNLSRSSGDSLASTLTERRYSAEQHLDPLNIQNSKFKILFSGPIDGEEKWNLMTAADLFVLPTYSENFGIAVAEALACGVPVITTTGAPWAGLLEHRCGWWVAPEVDAIGEALKDAIGLSDDERKAMGARGAEWVREEFAWEGIARKVVEGYEEILNV